MADKYDSVDMGQTTADMLRSNPDAARAALKAANTVEVACLIAESVEPSELSDHRQALSSLESANQIQEETQSPG
jgi:hypothetical protein